MMPRPFSQSLAACVLVGATAVAAAAQSPVRYALHEFAKNVYDLEASSADGTTLEVSRPSPHQWNVEGHDGEVTVRYTLFADRGDGTYSQVDRSHAHLNAPATFLYARALFDRPVELTVRVPEGSGWEVATQLAPGDDPYSCSAPDHAYFMDSPLEIAALEWRAWTVEREGRPLTLRVAMHHQGTSGELDRYAQHAEAIADELAAVYGGYPGFDFGTYTFLACYVPWASGDGMEHRNSTVLTSTGSLDRSMVGLLGTVAHEFFHAWNIERIRPASLEPFDFEDANMSGELWFGEGFTSYYDDLALVRTGIIDSPDFLSRVGSAAATVLLAPGRRFFSPVEMSLQAPFVDAATSVDPTNRANTFLSYYTWGSVVALGLDLTLRARPGELDLDALMREMWRRHGETERPYEVEDVEDALASLTGDARFAREFFGRFVRGREVPDFESLFRAMGVDFGPSASGAPDLTAARTSFGTEGMTLEGPTLFGDPLHSAGLDRWDRVRTVDGRVPSSRAALRRILARAAGATVRLEVEGRGARWETEATVDRRPVFRTVADPGADPEARARRAAWVAPRAGRTP
jgi:predicted metalloprotease with PDZ domain